MTYRLTSWLLFLFLGVSCSPKNPLANQRLVVPLTNVKSEAGYIYVIANGFGKNPKEAQEEAIRNAIVAVLFKGIPNSSVARPLVTQPGARQAYSDFFDPFFARNGQFLDYAVVRSHLTTDRIKIKSGVQRAVRLQVNYRELQRLLEDQGIIKSFGI